MNTINTITNLSGPHVTIIIVNYNSGDLLARALESLACQSRLADRVIVVDNHSNDDSLTSLPELDNLELIHSDSNLGFAGANNLAVKNIHDSDYLVLLNPDTVAEKNWLERLLLAAENNPGNHFFASKMIMDEKRQYYDGAGDIYHISGLAKRRYHGRRLDSVSDDRNEKIFSSCAGAAMYTRSSFNKAGGFDESFFCYMEDIDLGFRMQLMGYQGIYVHDAVIYHIGSAISGKHSDFSLYYGHRNLVWTYLKNMPTLLLTITLPLHLLLNIFTIIYFSFKGKRKVIISAKKDALLGIPAIWKQRRACQNSKRVSNYYIWSILKKIDF